MKSAFGDLRSDLDTLGERGKEVLDGELKAEISRQEQSAEQKTIPMAIEQQRRAERAVLASLLDHPLPVSTVAIELAKKQQEEAAAAGIKNEDVEMGEATAAEGVESMAPAKLSSG